MDRSLEIYDGEGELSSRTFRDLTWSDVRQKRDDALNNSDWRAVKDRVLPNEWKEFRDLLRTLPQRFVDPNDAADNFPVMPDE